MQSGKSDKKNIINYYYYGHQSFCASGLNAFSSRKTDYCYTHTHTHISFLTLSNDTRHAYGCSEIL